MDKDKAQEVVSLLQSMTTGELQVFESLAVKELKVRAREPSAIPEDQHGSPKDTAVQKLAAWQLTWLRGVQQLTYREIAERLGVSIERVRQLHMKLCPTEFEHEKIG